MSVICRAVKITNLAHHLQQSCCRICSSRPTTGCAMHCCVHLSVYCRLKRPICPCSLSSHILDPLGSTRTPVPQPAAVAARDPSPMQIVVIPKRGFRLRQQQRGAYGGGRKERGCRLAGGQDAALGRGRGGAARGAGCGGRGASGGVLRRARWGAGVAACSSQAIQTQVFTYPRVLCMTSLSS